MKRLTFSLFLGLGFACFAQAVDSDLVGTFYSQVDDYNTTAHFMVKRTADGKYVTKKMFVDHKAKKYAFDDSKGAWRVDGKKYVVINADGQETRFEIKRKSAQELIFLLMLEDGSVSLIHEKRVNGDTLKNPPTGYKQVELNDY